MKAKLITERSKAILIKNLARRMLGDDLEKYEIEAINKDGEASSEVGRNGCRKKNSH